MCYLPEVQLLIFKVFYWRSNPCLRCLQVNVKTIQCVNFVTYINYCVTFTRVMIATFAYQILKLCQITKRI